MSKYIETKEVNGELVHAIEMRDLKKHGEHFFKTKPDAKAVYVSNGWNKHEKRYDIENYENGNELCVKSNRKIWIGFTY